MGRKKKIVEQEPTEFAEAVKQLVGDAITDLENDEALAAGEDLQAEIEPIKKRGRGRPPKAKTAEVLEQMALQPRKEIEVTTGLFNGLFCTFTYTHNLQQNISNEVRVKSGVPVHPDLAAAFRRLDVHLAVICDEVRAEEIDDIDDLPQLDPSLEMDDERQHPLAAKLALYSVNAFRLVGNGENEGVVLSGEKTLSDMETLPLTAPTKKFSSEYPFVNELRVAIADLVSEIERYYWKGKRAEERQTSLQFPEDNGRRFEDDEDI